MDEVSEGRGARARRVGWAMCPGGEVSEGEASEGRSIRGTRCPGAKYRMGDAYGDEVSEGQCVRPPFHFMADEMALSGLVLRCYCVARQVGEPPSIFLRAAVEGFFSRGGDSSILWNGERSLREA